MKELNKAISKATMDASRTKQRYHEMVSGVASLKTSVDTQGDWAWLKDADSLLKPLILLKDNISTNMSSFSRNFIDLGIKDAKAGLEPNSLLDALRTFKSALEPQLAEAERQLKFLRATHSLRSRK